MTSEFSNLGSNRNLKLKTGFIHSMEMKNNDEVQDIACQLDIYATSVRDELVIEERKLEEEGRRIVAEQNIVLDRIERKYQQVRARRESIERIGESPVFDKN